MWPMLNFDLKSKQEMTDILSTMNKENVYELNTIFISLF
jgi:hypothetical protein